MMPEPNIRGPHGRAWVMDIETFRAKHQRNGKDATVGGWIIQAPWAHPVWHSYVLFVIHLRPLPQMPPPRKSFVEATHEIMLFALNPQQPYQNVVDPPPYLLPANFVAQFVAASDEAAKVKCESHVMEILEGKLSPDTDHMQSWIARFNASCVKGDPKTAGQTVIKAEDGSVTVIGTGRAAMEAIMIAGTADVPEDQRIKNLEINIAPQPADQPPDEGSISE